MSMVGKTLGAFECTALIGKDGMGEVYRAKDQKLGRDVAIKVLPEEFANDADRVIQPIIQSDPISLLRQAWYFTSPLSISPL